MTQSVNDIPDAELLRRAVQSIDRIKPRARPHAGVPLWSAVANMFCLGSTYSQQLCMRLGFNPDERVRR